MYSIVTYKDSIADKDAATQKRYALIERLSKGFTAENKIALEMDKLLVKQLELENEPEPTRAENPQTKTVHKTTEKLDVEQRFTELFESLKNNQGHSVKYNATDIKQSVQEILKQTKIGIDNLDEAVLKKLAAHVQVIKYEIPKTKTSEFAKPEIRSFQSIVDDILIGNNVMLIGGAGTGKTYLAENLISKIALGRQHITINCSQWTSTTEIIGVQTFDGIVEGKLIEAWKNGYILILDELPKIDPNTAGLFNDALAKTKIPHAVIFNSRRESFSKHPDFACIATGNIYPDKESITYGANNKQDLSLLDRFSGSVYFIEKNPAIEKMILQNEMIWSISDRMRSVIEEMKYEAQLSLRFMQNARDAYNLEMQRVKDKGKDGVKADDGKTFKAAVDSFLSTFTEVQQKNIKDKIRYAELFPHYAYRAFDITKSVY